MLYRKSSLTPALQNQVNGHDFWILRKKGLGKKIPGTWMGLKHLVWLVESVQIPKAMHFLTEDGVKKTEESDADQKSLHCPVNFQS